RGHRRPVDLAGYMNASGGDGSDIGAYERQPEVIAPDPQPATNEDTPVEITLQGRYDENTNLDFTIVQSPINGSLGTISASDCSFVNPVTPCTATVTYTPNTNFNGGDTFKFRVVTNPGELQSDPTDVNITVNPVNDAPSFTRGPDQTTFENSGAQTVPNWATNLSPGPANESLQHLNFLITNNTNAGLFSAGPVISPTGALTYTPAASTSGFADITVVLKDDGGTANGGVDISPPQTFRITVNDGGTLQFSAATYSVSENG